MYCLVQAISPGLYQVVLLKEEKTDLRSIVPLSAVSSFRRLVICHCFWPLVFTFFSKGELSLRSSLSRMLFVFNSPGSFCESQIIQSILFVWLFFCRRMDRSFEDYWHRFFDCVQSCHNYSSVIFEIVVSIDCDSQSIRSHVAQSIFQTNRLPIDLSVPLDL